MSKIVPPSVRETAFNCPHCSAFTTQYWYDLYTKPRSEDSPLPVIWTESSKADVRSNPDLEQEHSDLLYALIDKLKAGLVIITEEFGAQTGHHVGNLHLSKCYNCKKIAVWVYDRIVFPVIKAGDLPNADLPPDILADFEEARGIVNESARGAAALLRLCIQKLCKHLGEKGKNIDDDIASLVRKGLSPRVKQSLDIVRVIGNEAVHPGTLDLKDDRDTALQLFGLVNAIAQQMISHPKAVEEMYAKLPEGKRKAIEQRDKQAAESPAGSRHSE